MLKKKDNSGMIFARLIDMQKAGPNTSPTHIILLHNQNVVLTILAGLPKLDYQKCNKTLLISRTQHWIVKIPFLSFPIPFPLSWL